MIDYSFVIPCYNSSKTISSVVDEIRKVMQNNAFSYEIILVNDHSSDQTKETIFGLTEQYDNITALSLTKNFGQHAALLAGYRYAQGTYVISLDDDGQTPADQVLKLIDKLNEGYDVVFARYPVIKESLFRRMGSRLNDLMAVSLIGKPRDLALSSYFIAKKYIIDEIIRYRNPFPYVAGLILRSTASIANADVDHRERLIGRSGYSLSKLLSLWLNGFTAFSIKPLRVGSIAGFLMAMLGFAICIYAVIHKLLQPDTAVGWASLIGVVTVIGGSILIMLGLIGEYLGRIYLSINDSPQYVIEEIRTGK